MTKLRLRNVLGAITGILAIAVIWVLFFDAPQTRPILHPESGYQLPIPADVASMEMDYYDYKCNISEQYWGNILEHLAPSEREPDEMVISMMNIGRLSIQLRSSESIIIDLYETGTRLWFCVRTPGPGTYYYAGSRAPMEDALRAACQHSQNSNRESAGSEP